MARRDTSIAAAIELLARETGAPQAFVERIRGLFHARGVSLEADAAPYRIALELAFRREQLLRRGAHEMRGQLEELERQLHRLGQVFRAQLERLQRLESMRRGRPAPAEPSGDFLGWTIEAPPSFGTRPQTRFVRGILVPGPKEPQ